MFERKVQLSVLMENQPGRFGELCDKLYELGVDIYAMSATPIGESGILRLVVDDPEKAGNGLRSMELSYLQADVLVARVPNESGMAAGIGQRFKDGQVNIEYTYFSSGEPGTLALMVFKVTDTERALRVLNGQADSYN